MRRVNFFEGEIEQIDLDSRQVSVCHGADRHAHTLAYDHLVLALGSVTNFFGLRGLEERAITMKTLGDAAHLRSRLIANLEEADTECACEIRDRLLTVVVAGGGFAGVETVAGIYDFLRDALRFYPHLAVDNLRVVLVHSGAKILPELGDDLGGYAQQKLAARGVEILTHARVVGVSDEGVEISTGQLLPTTTLVWTAGTAPHPLLHTLPCAKDRGRLVVDEYLQLSSHTGVWALGDCAVVPNRRTGTPHPPTAQHAIRQGLIAARNIAAMIDGGRKRPFAFSTIGQLAAIGRRTGVARILGLKFSGFFAWWLWRTIYLSKLPRFEKNLRVALDWTLDLFFSKDTVKYLTPRGSGLSHSDHGHPDFPMPRQDTTPLALARVTDSATSRVAMVVQSAQP